jgi:predicted NBD/HSP70 family sugar kinase
MVVRGQSGQRSGTIRRANLSTIVTELHRSGPLSRSELVGRTGLTRSAIRALIGELAAGGLVSEVTSALDGTPGRPSSLVRPEPFGAVVLAFDIAVESLGAATVGLGGEMIDSVREDLPPDRTSLDDVVDALVRLADRLVDRTALEPQLVGAGVGVAGLVRRRDGMVALAPNLDWHDEPLGSRLADVLGGSIPVTVANEADLAALAESRRGAAGQADDTIMVWGAVGVGGGLIVAGRPLTGSDGYSGEIGHMPVDPDGDPCTCGSHGCWETKVGTRAIMRRAGYSPDVSAAAFDGLIRDAEAGVPAVLDALTETGRWLGIGLVGLINVFNPSLVLLGGRFARLDPFVRPALEAELDRRALAPSRHEVAVIPTRLGSDAQLRGAAELAFDPLLTDPSAWLRPRIAGAAFATA